MHRDLQRREPSGQDLDSFSPVAALYVLIELREGGGVQPAPVSEADLPDAVLARHPDVEIEVAGLRSPSQGHLDLVDVLQNRLRRSARRPPKVSSQDRLQLLLKLLGHVPRPES